MIDIIIPCWTKKIPEITTECIDSIVRNTKDFNLIIVGRENGTQPCNINVGIEKSKADYFVIFDWDVIVPEGWLEKMIQVLEKNPEVGIVSPAQEGKYVEHFQAYAPNGTNEAVESGSAIGACMVCRNIGLKWDENYPAGYWCDTDFGRQYKEKGYKIFQHNGVIVKHDIHTTANKSDFVNEMMKRGELIYFSKWGDLNV